jgi:hypothetical protein
MSDELKPCPFCGARDLFAAMESWRVKPYVDCNGCHRRFSAFLNAEEWNRRAHLSGQTATDPEPAALMNADVLEALRLQGFALANLFTEPVKNREGLVEIYTRPYDPEREHSGRTGAGGGEKLPSGNVALDQQCASGSEAGARYWLIEYVPVKGDNAKQPLWWNGTHWNGHDDMAWTHDANNAIRFVSMVEASVVAMALMGYTKLEDRKIGKHRREDWYGEFKPTEHEWPSALAQATTESKR